MSEYPGQNYSQEAFDNVSVHNPKIAATADALGLRPEAIFGALVEENNDYRQGWLKNFLGDGWALSHAGSHGMLVQYYQRAEQEGTIDKHGTWDKINPVLNDLGPYNIQLGTAIRLLRRYLESASTDNDPLNLRRYANDYPSLASHLADGSVSPEIAGLMLKEAKVYMQQHADPEYWAQKSAAYRDAIYLTYYNMGKTLIEKKRPLNIQTNDGKYRPEPGAREAAGKDHLKNAEKIGTLFGHPDYHRSTAEVPPLAEQPDHEEPVLPRAPSISFIEYPAPHIAQLKANGTLSDIIALENLRGNPITQADLRLVNGLTPKRDHRLPEDFRLLVPRRRGDELRVDDGVTSLRINRLDGTYQFTQGAENGETTHYCRRWDPAQQQFFDLYAKTTSAGQTEGERRYDVAAWYGELFRSIYHALSDGLLPVESSNLARIGYDHATWTLTVQFLNGRIYEYYLVPRHQYDAFLSAPSKGRFLNRHIKGVYVYNRIQ